jgi:flagellar export protein FliJ
MGFRFRLERVLSVRADQERQSLVNVARVQQRRDGEARGLNHLLSQAQAMDRRWEGLRGNSLPAEEIHWIRRRRSGLRKDVERQRIILQEWDGKLIEARDHWVEARKKTKALEVLRERAWRTFTTGILKAEMVQLDEVSLRPFLQEDRAGQEEG